MNRFVTIFFILLFGSLHLQAELIEVPQEQPTIQAGIDVAVDGDTVLVAEGTYLENINFLGKAILLGSRFILDGDTTHIANTVIDGSQPADADSGSVVYFTTGEDSNAVLSGFTITGGSGTLLPTILEATVRGGGGIYCYDAQPRISHNRIINNIVNSPQEGVGGGLMSFTSPETTITASSELIVENNLFAGNSITADSTAGGGAILVTSPARIVGNRLRNNSLQSGGISFGAAILASNFSQPEITVYINENEILTNTAAADIAATGAIHCEYLTASVRDNHLRGNGTTADVLCWGGGIAMIETAPGSEIADNQLIANNANSNPGRGGGIVALAAGDLTIRQNHLRDNSATVGGGLLTWQSVAKVQNNLIVNNTAEQGAGLWILNVPDEPNAGPAEKLLIPHWKNRRQVDLSRLREAPGTPGSAALSAVGEIQLINNTIADNRASVAGGGIFANFPGILLENSIVWGNDAPQEAQIRGDLFANYCDIQGGYPGSANLDQDPQFSGDENYYLTPGSPAIDGGNPAASHQDREDPANPGAPLWPALGELRNDLGAYGGNPDITLNTTDLRGPQFRAFVERVIAAPYDDRPAIVDSFLNAVPGFPFVEENTIAYFLYRGNANQVTVPGDANGWDGNAFPMTRLSSTNLWYYEGVFEADARLDYKFVLNGSNWILDPRNPRQVWGGFGPNSELAMPEYQQPPEIVFDPAIPHGTLHDTLFHSNILNNNRLIRIYTPPGYEAAPEARFPVALFHDGLEYLSLASADNVLDNLIAQQRIDPLIAVFVPPINRNDEYAFNQTVEFSAFILDEVMPYIDAAFRTESDPMLRAMLGISFGGLITTQICYNHPEAFGLAAPSSPAYWPKNGEILRQVLSGPKKDLAFYLDWGTYEVGIMLDGRQLRDFLTDQGYPLQWNEWHEGHSWGNWRAHLDEALEFFFPGAAVAIAEDHSPNPQRFSLEQNYPNPFNPSTRIAYQLSAVSEVELSIYNILGQKVTTLVSQKQAPGYYTREWNGRDDHGAPVASGVYLYRLQAGQEVQTRKMLLVR